MLWPLTCLGRHVMPSLSRPSGREINSPDFALAVNTLFTFLTIQRTNRNKCSSSLHPSSRHTRSDLEDSETSLNRTLLPYKLWPDLLSLLLTYLHSCLPTTLALHFIYKFYSSKLTNHIPVLVKTNLSHICKFSLSFFVVPELEKGNIGVSEILVQYCTWSNHDITVVEKKTLKKT